MFGNKFSIWKSPESKDQKDTHDKINTDVLFDLAINQKIDELMKIINENKIDINDIEITDRYNNSLLHIAVRKSNTNMVQALILLNGDIHKKNYFYESPLDIAIQRNDTKMIIMLLHNENKIENSQKKRSKGELNLLESQNKKLKVENNKLKEDNKVLEDTIRNLKND